MHERFMALVPRIERHGRIQFRHLKCPGQKADCVAEMVALCWKWIKRLNEQGKDGFAFPMVLASFAAKHVKAGRKVAGQESAQDAMNPIAQQRHSFTVQSMPAYSTLEGNPLEEALHDEGKTPIPDLAAFRIDFPAWLATRTERDRRMIEQLGMNHRTTDVANRFGLAFGRISQLRREYREDWTRFCSE